MTFSWQKALGGEAAHGMLILSPRAVARLESYKPAWPLPKLFRMTKGGKLNEAIFEGETINTPSMLCLEDYLDALAWAKSIGGTKALVARSDANTKMISNWVARTPWIAFLADDPAIRSNTSVCLKVVDPAVTGFPPDAQAAFAKGMSVAPGEGRRRLRHRLLPRCAAGLAHLVRRDRRGVRCRGADAVARLGLRRNQGRAAQGGVRMFADQLVARLVDFVRSIGIDVQATELAEPTFVPGLDIRGGALLIDAERLAYPGDILHEAGHIAVSDPAVRSRPELKPSDGEEIATLAWSYAAARHLKLAPEVVFHPDGYKGGASSLVENFTAGHYIGVPLLQYFGLTVEPRLAAARGVEPYPHMLRWLR